MRIAKIITSALILSLISFSVDATAAEPPKGFRSFIWGAAPSADLKKFSGPTSDGVSLYVTASKKKPQPLFDVPVAEESYSFSRRKFYSGNAWIDGQENFEKTKAFLIKTYGSPTFTNESLNLWKWKWLNSKVEVHLSYQAKFSRTTVTFLNNGI